MDSNTNHTNTDDWAARKVRALFRKAIETICAELVLAARGLR